MGARFIKLADGQERGVACGAATSGWRVEAALDGAPAFVLASDDTALATVDREARRRAAAALRAMLLFLETPLHG